MTANSFIGPVQGNLTYFFNHSTSNSSITGFHDLSLYNDGHAETTTIYSMTGAISNILIESFATDIGDPNVTTMLNGDWQINKWITNNAGTNCTVYTTI